MLDALDSHLYVQFDAERTDMLSKLATDLTNAMGFQLESPWPLTYAEARTWITEIKPKHQTVRGWTMLVQPPNPSDTLSVSLHISRKGKPLQYIVLDHHPDGSWRFRVSLQAGMFSDQHDAANLVTHVFWGILATEVTPTP